MSMRFQCVRCGACCRHVGEVRVGAEEVEAMARSLRIDIGSFTGRYTMLRSDRRGLRLAERPDGACVFLAANPTRCDVQAAKPAQCREFPLTWHYPDDDRTCPAALRQQPSP